MFGNILLATDGSDLANKAVEQGRLTRENTRRAALGIAPLTSVDQLESAELPETILLREAGTA